MQWFCYNACVFWIFFLWLAFLQCKLRTKFLMCVNNHILLLMTIIIIIMFSSMWCQLREDLLYVINYSMKNWTILMCIDNWICTIAVGLPKVFMLGVGCLPCYPLSPPSLCLASITKIIELILRRRYRSSAK